MMSRIMRPNSSARAAIEPITIPAMAPPDNPLPLLDPVAAAEEVDEEVAVDVTVLVAREIEAVIVGRTTPTHLESALAL
jgi:hypothetical protein